MIKQILLIFVLLTSSLLATNTETDLRLNHYPRALKWLQDADTNGESAYNIGVLYHKEIKDNDKAIEWYTKAYGMNNEGSTGSAANNMASIYDDLKKYEESIKWYKSAISKNYKSAYYNLGILYKKLHQYNDAIFYYKKAYERGSHKGAYSLGYLYDVDLHDFPNAIIWYKKAAKKGHSTAIKNLAYVYRDMKDNLTSSAYLMALIPNNYSKSKIFNRLNNIWKIDKTIQIKAYKLQQTLDIPKHYTGGID